MHTYARASVKRRSESLLQFNWLKQPSLLHVKNFRTKNFARKNRAKIVRLGSRLQVPLRRVVSLCAWSRVHAKASCRSDSLAGVISDGAKSAQGARAERGSVGARARVRARALAGPRAGRVPCACRPSPDPPAFAHCAQKYFYLLGQHFAILTPKPGSLLLT